MSLIVPPRQGLEDRISVIAETAYERYRRAVQPIYGAKNGTPAHVGSCFFLRVGAQRYVVTAAHVVDESQNSKLYIPLGPKLVAIEGSFACTNVPVGDREKDHYDFAYALADPEYFVDSERAICIEEADISLNRVAVPSHAYMVIGYPRSKNKKFDTATKLIVPKIWHYYATGRAVPELYQRLQLSGDDHIAMRYEEQSRTAEGEWVNSISARGMSGSPLIDLGPQAPPMDNTAEPFGGRLSGIFIEHHDDVQVLLSVKINLMVEKIRALVDEGVSITPDRAG